MMNSMQQIFGSYRKLSNMKRFTFHHTHHNQSVAEHSFQVAMLAFHIASDLNYFGAEKLNPEKVATMALFHDVPESYTGDITYTFKKRLEKIVDLEQLEMNLFDELFEGTHIKEFGEPFMWPSHYSGFNKTECAIVKLADTLELVIFALEECERGNSNFSEMFTRMINVIKEQYDFMIQMSPFLTNLISDLQEYKQLHHPADKTLAMQGMVKS